MPYNMGEISLIGSASPLFVLFVGLIVGSLLLNQLSNLVYRVINLAGLSLLIISL
jgi:hypothetical protein